MVDSRARKDYSHARGFELERWNLAGELACAKMRWRWGEDCAKASEAGASSVLEFCSSRTRTRSEAKRKAERTALLQKPIKGNLKLCWRVRTIEGRIVYVSIVCLQSSDLRRFWRKDWRSWLEGKISASDSPWFLAKLSRLNLYVDMNSIIL
jgi:hypothetical protein